jgi:hypothetical protein
MAVPFRFSRRLALDGQFSRRLAGTATLLLFVCNKLFNFNGNIRPHDFLEASNVAKELLFCLFWFGRSPISDKNEGARINSGLADTFAAKATLEFEFFHLYVLTLRQICRGRLEKP